MAKKDRWNGEKKKRRGRANLKKGAAAKKLEERPEKRKNKKARTLPTGFKQSQVNPLAVFAAVSAEKNGYKVGVIFGGKT